MAGRREAGGGEGGRGGCRCRAPPAIRVPPAHKFTRISVNLQTVGAERTHIRTDQCHFAICAPPAHKCTRISVTLRFVYASVSRAGMYTHQCHGQKPSPREEFRMQNAVSAGKGDACLRGAWWPSVLSAGTAAGRRRRQRRKGGLGSNRHKGTGGGGGMEREETTKSGREGSEGAGGVG